MIIKLNLRFIIFQYRLCHRNVFFINIDYCILCFIRLKEGEMTYTISQSFYEQNNSVSNNGSQYFMDSNSFEFIDDVSIIVSIFY